MKNGLAYKNQNFYLKINIYLNQAFNLPCRSVLPLYRNQSTGLWSKSMEWFMETMATLDSNKLILTTIFPIYYFLLSWRNPSTISPSVQPNRIYFSKKHKTKNANWTYSKPPTMFFWILIKLNFISSPICWKKILCLRKFLNSESTAYFWDEIFYHKYIPLFLITVSTATVIKATKYSTCYIIHNLYDVATKYSISALKLVKLSCLVGSADKNMYISTWPACSENIENFYHWIIIHLSTRL